MANKNDFLTSMTDLMISLVLIFMLLLASTMLKLNDQTNESNKTRQKLKEELSRVLKENFDKDLDVQNVPTDPLSIKIILGESENTLKFERGSYNLNNKDKAFLDKLMPEILNTLNKPEYKNEIDTIKIEGYTDNDKYIGKNVNYSNVELSQDRALVVFNYTRKHSLNNQKSLKEFFIDKTSINGKGDIPEYLICKNEKNDCKNNPNNVDKQKSRRVEIKIKIKSYDETKLQNKNHKIQKVISNK